MRRNKHEQTKICARHFVEFWKPSPNSGFCTNHQRLHQSLHAPTKSCRQMHLVRHPTSISAQANVASSTRCHSFTIFAILLGLKRPALVCVHLTEIDYPGVLWRLTVTGNSQGLKSAVCEVRKGGCFETSSLPGLHWSVICCRLPIRGPDCKEVIFAVGSDLQLLSTLRSIYQKR